MKNRNLPWIVFFMVVMAACNNHPAGTEKKDSVVSAPAVSESPKHISILDAEGRNLLDSTATIEIIAEGYKWTEGPVYVSDSDYLLFSDVPANRI